MRGKMHRAALMRFVVRILSWLALGLALACFAGGRVGPGALATLLLLALTLAPSLLPATGRTRTRATAPRTLSERTV